MLTMRELRARGHELVGLTARSPEAVDETAGQLAACRLADLLGAETFGELGAVDGPKPPLTHDRGVVYCTGSRKPAGLLAFEAKRRQVLAGNDTGAGDGAQGGGCVDGGVVVGLSWGVSSVLLLYLKQKFFGGLPTRADPCLPASAAQAKGQ